MRRRFGQHGLACATLLGFALATSGARAAAQPSLTGNPTVDAVLAGIRAADAGQLAISDEDGRFLRLMAASSRSQRALEIGGASGFSAIWIALGLRETGGRLTTIEYDPGRARLLGENIKKAGLADIVQVVPGDAFAAIPTLTGSFDFVFLDAWKKDYKRFLDLVAPRLSAGGLLLGHNVINKRSELGDFLSAVQNDTRFFTTIVQPSGEGVSITYKRRDSAPSSKASQ